MKNRANPLFICFSILLLGFFNSLFAQCIQNISTNPAAPSNTQFENIPVYQGKDNVFLNSFDWAENDGATFNGIYLNGQAGWNLSSTLAPGQDFIMANPFASSNNTSLNNYSHILEPSGGASIERDFHWEDGWELLYMNTGFYPDGQRINIADQDNIIPYATSPNNNRVPHLILYNRYQGKVRVFFNVFSELAQLDDIKLITGFPNSAVGDEELSGLFRHLSSYDTPLDRPTDVEEFISWNRDNNNDSNWYTAEFRIGYDPCTCNFPSTLEMSLRGIKSLDLTLQGRSITVDEDLFDTMGNPKYDQDFLSNFSGNEQGLVIYKKMDGLIENYQGRLTDYNQALADQKAYKNNFGLTILNMLEDIVVNGATAILPTQELADWLSMTAGDIMGDDDLIDADDLNKEIIKGAKSVLGKGYESLSASILGKKPNKPQKPSMPTASYSEMKFVGDISDTIPIQIPQMMVPGTYPHAYTGLPDLEPWNYPAYNEVLGQFAILNSPELDMTDYEVNSSTGWAPGTGGSLVCSTNVTKYTKLSRNERTVRFKLDDSLMYVLNPALDFDMDNTNVYAALIVKLKGGSDIYVYPSTSMTATDITRTLVDRSELELRNWFRSCANVNQNCENTVVLETPWLKIGKLKNRVFSGKLVSDALQQKCSSFPSLPGVTPSEMSLEIESVELKIMADMYFDQLNYHGVQNENTQVSTFLLYSSTDTRSLDLVDFTSSNGSSMTPLYEPGTTTLGGSVTYGPSSSAITSIVGNTLYITGEQIIVTGTVSVSSGYTLIIQGIESVTISSSGQLNEGVTALVDDMGEINHYGLKVHRFF